MDEQSVTTENDGGIWVVRLERPRARNAVDPAAARALYEAFVAFEACADARVAVLTGTPEVFCSGFDLKALAGGTADRWLEELHFGVGGRPPLGPMGPTRLMLSKPVLAAIAGPAVAGGMELAAWCDLRVMEEDAYMGVFCRRFGVPLIDGGTIRLPALVGRGRALDLILSGRRVDAAECAAMGLCDRVVATGAALPAALAWARELARFPQACLRADRASVLGDAAAVQAAMQTEFAGGLAVLDKEAREGAKAFLRGAGRHGEPGPAGPGPA
jgi:enoyl-CoA hydratase